MAGAGVGIGALAVDLHRHAVHDHVPHAHRLVGREPLGVGREVAHPADRARCDGVGVEHDHVSPRARPQVPAVGDAEQVGLHAGELAHGTLHRHHPAVAHPAAEEVGRLGRVAQLADVRAGVRESERAVLFTEQ